jgi:hypothetical protein
MKKFYFLGIALLGALTLSAQSSKSHKRQQYAEFGTRNAVEANQNRDIIWQDDFSSAANWSIAHDGLIDADWEIGTGLVSSGQYGTPAIMSTTADNGYAMYNSDGFNNQSANYEQAHITTASPIDLSNYSNVILEFQTQYRRYNDEQTYVIISTDGTFPTIDDPNMDISIYPNVYRAWEVGELTQGVSPGNPTTRRFNISSVAGNQQQVWVRLQFTGIWGYAWYVDDINIYEQYQYDTRLSSGYTSTTGEGEEYANIPLAQLPGTMNLGCYVENYGFDTLTNVVISAIVTDEATNSVQFEAHDTVAILLADSIYNMNEFPALPTLALGRYNAYFTLTSDQMALEGDTTNNFGVRYFEVTDDVYSMDGIGVHPTDIDVYTSIGTNSFTDNADELMLMTYYEMFAPAEVYGFQVFLTSTSVAGGEITALLYDTTEVSPGNAGNAGAASLSFEAQSNTYITSQADIDSGYVIIPFDAPVALSAMPYYAAVQLISNSNTYDTRVVDDLTVPQPGMASAIYLPSDATIYSNGNAFAIRLIMNSIGCNDATACNYDPQVTYLFQSCQYPGCTDDQACNYTPGAGCDDGTCGAQVGSACDDGNANTTNDLVLPGCACEGSIPLLVEGVDAAEVSFFPNPASDVMTLNFNGVRPNRIEVYSVTGKLVHSGSWVNTFDVSTLADGMYFLRTIGSDKSEDFKFEVRH